MATEVRTNLPERWVNPKVLEWARQRMGLKPQHVEELTDIPAPRITRWEQSLESPTLDNLEDIAEIYDCPVGYFFLDAPPDIKPALNYRGLTAEKTETLSYETHTSLNRYVYLTNYIASLIDKIGIQREIQVGKAELREPINLLAKRERQSLGFSPQIREQWASPNEAFDFWRHAIEAKGIFVITLKLETSEVRGASRWEHAQTPSILVNRMDMEAATGRCFTLLHEWAHLLTKRTGLVCDFQGQARHTQIERFANKFAAEVLVPRTELEDYLKQENLFKRRPRWGDSLLNKIRGNFKVSKDVIAILLEELDLAESGFYKSKRASWDQRKPFFPGYILGHVGSKRSQTKAERRLTELGLPVAQLTSRAYGQGAISKLDLADLLNMKVEQAEGFVSWVHKLPK